MSIVHLSFEYSDTFSEVLVGDVKNTELAIESVVAPALLELFDAVHIKEVTVHHSPEDYDGDRERW